MDTSVSAKIAPFNRKKLVFFSIFSIFVCVIWNWFSGKDLNWDQLNYHFYLPHSFIADRLQQDFFPASIQSYLNPVSYLPFYWMVKADWNSLIIGSILAAGHATNLIALYLLSLRLLPGITRNDDYFRSMAIVIGALSPIFWIEVGSSFNDISISALTLVAIYIGLGKKTDVNAAPGFLSIALSGFLFGIIVGLKLTFAVFAVAGVMLFIDHQREKLFTKLLIYALGGVIGFITTNGWWLYHLLKVFQNPIFPFYNKIFSSPFFIIDNLNLVRFIPASWKDLLLLPFEMMEPVSWVYTETTSPDLRPAFIFTVSFILFFKHIFFQKIAISSKRPSSISNNSHFSIHWRFFLFLLISLMLWILTSTNGRYGIPIALLSGVIVVWLSRLLFTPRVALMVTFTLALAQCGHMLFTANARWSPDKWTPTWFEIDVPPVLIEKPHLFLSVGLQSNAFLAPFVHSKSSFVNISGQSSIDTVGEAGNRVLQLIQQHRGSVLVLTNVSYDIASTADAREIFLQKLSFPLARFGLQLDGSQCQFLRSKRSTAPEHDQRPDAKERVHYWMMTCPADEVPISQTEEKSRRNAARLFNSIAATCPNLFSPKAPTVERTSFGYMQHYVGTEFTLLMNSKSKQIWAFQVHASADIDFGSVDDWNNGARKDFTCPGRHRSSPWFQAKP